jgi:Flp pilus assembly pilin Flp
MHGPEKFPVCLLRKRGVWDHTGALYLTHTYVGDRYMLKRFLRDETGAELAEYAVGVALLVAIGVVVYSTLGQAINTSNSTTGTTIKSATPTW